MKIQHAMIVDGIRRVSDDEASEVTGDVTAGVGDAFVRVDLKLEGYLKFPPGAAPRNAFIVESIGGIALFLRRENAKGVYIGQKLRILIDGEI